MASFFVINRYRARVCNRLKNLEFLDGSEVVLDPLAEFEIESPAASARPGSAKRPATPGSGGNAPAMRPMSAHKRKQYAMHRLIISVNATMVTQQDYNTFLKKVKDEVRLQEKAHEQDMKRLRNLSDALQKKTGISLHLLFNTF